MLYEVITKQGAVAGEIHDAGAGADVVAAVAMGREDGFARGSTRGGIACQSGCADILCNGRQVVHGVSEKLRKARIRDLPASGSQILANLCGHGALNLNRRSRQVVEGEGAANLAGDTGRQGLEVRITSYNVCYTKLLRRCWAW